jgi:hypothetical protein
MTLTRCGPGADGAAVEADDRASSDALLGTTSRLPRIAPDAVATSGLSDHRAMHPDALAGDAP